MKLEARVVEAVNDSLHKCFQISFVWCLKMWKSASGLSDKNSRQKHLSIQGGLDSITEKSFPQKRGGTNGIHSLFKRKSQQDFRVQ
jgi:hypothetical protein